MKSREGTKHARSPPWRMSAPVAAANASAAPAGGGDCPSAASGTSKSLDLGDIEDGEGAQHGNLSLFVFGVVLLHRELFGEDDLRALFALAHMRSLVERLLEGEPGMGGEAVRVGRMPQDRDIDAPIVMPGDGVGRHNADAAAALPRLHPGRCALFEFGDYGLRDGAINGGYFHGRLRVKERMSCSSLSTHGMRRSARSSRGKCMKTAVRM